MSLPKDAVPNAHDDALVATVVRAAAGVPAGGCPDAEVLGLYAEHGLADDELTATAAHVAACARCQGALAAFVRATPPAAPALAMGDGVLGARWFGSRWLVPAASAAGVAIVAIWLGRGPSEEADRMARAVTEGDPSAVPAPATPPATSSAAPALEPALQATPPTRAVMDAVERQQRDLPADRFARSTDPAVQAQVPLEDLRRRTDAPLDELQKRAQESARLADARIGAVVGERAAGALPPPPPAAVAPPPSPPAQVVPPAPPVGVAAPAREPAAQGLAAHDSARAAEKSTAAESRAEATTEDRANSPAALTTFRASVDETRWRVRDGRVERSTDQGKAWRPSTTPAGLRVLAVAPVSVDACWAIATNAVLRTIDGVTWTRVSVPSSEPLVSISASGAAGAAVVTASGARWTTSDGGATWQVAR